MEDVHLAPSLTPLATCEVLTRRDGEPRRVVGFEATLDAYSPLLMADDSSIAVGLWVGIVLLVVGLILNAVPIGGRRRRVF